MKYVEFVKIPQKCLERINRLLDIEALDAMTESELLEAGASADYFEGVFYVEFEDGSSLTYDLCSGQHNYYDNVVWVNAAMTKELVLDCTYELCDIVFEADGNLYAVYICT